MVVLEEFIPLITLITKKIDNPKEAHAVLALHCCGIVIGPLSISLREGQMP